MPYQMFGCAWVGMLAGFLSPLRGKAEILMLACYGAAAGYVFGFMLNLSFWPFSLDPSSSMAYRPGLSFVEQWHRYLLFDASTSLGWDTGRAITNVVAILLAGPAVLAVFAVLPGARTSGLPSPSGRPRARTCSPDQPRRSEDTAHDGQVSPARCEHHYDLPEP